MTDWRIEVGDCRDVLRTMPARSVHTCTTSPPFYGLRDYGVDGQLGLESTPDEFVAALVGVFREVRRVLRDDGTVWLNLGDSYTAGAGSRNGMDGSGLKRNVQDEAERQRCLAENKVYRAHPVGGVSTGCKPKDLLGIPWMVAFALRADGWYLRSDIVWSKPNPMPESVTDRPTKAHEYVFLMSKRATYHYDADAIREPHTTNLPVVAKPKSQMRHVGDGDLDERARDRWGALGYGNGGRNKRSVWTVATQPYAGAHFATFPPKLIEPCILAGAPERVCGECGAPWLRVVERRLDEAKAERIRVRPSRAESKALANGNRKDGEFQSLSGQEFNRLYQVETTGFEPSCSHGDGSASGVVLDPFAGAGTTGIVALQRGRDFIGIELNAEYARMARERIETAVRLGFRSPQNGGAQLAGQLDIFGETA